MTGLRRRLTIYFLVLAVLPLTLGYFVFATVVERSEQRRLDASLHSSLTAAVSGYDRELQTVEEKAEDLAQSPKFLRALERGDRPALKAMLARVPGVRLESGDLQIGKAPLYSGELRVDISDRGSPLGELIATAPLTASRLSGLAQGAGLPAGYQLLVAEEGRVVVPARYAHLATGAADANPADIRLGGETKRLIVSSSLATEGGEIDLALAVPKTSAQAAATNTEHELLLALAALLLLTGAVAFFEGRWAMRNVGGLVKAARSIAGGNLSERVPVRGRDELSSLAASFNEMAVQLEARVEDLEHERLRLREATLRFGEGLGASHDSSQLLRFVVESAVDATQAVGGIAVSPSGERIVIGEPELGEEKSEWSLKAGRESLGTLILTAQAFTSEELEMVAILCGHAAVALDNARLHRIVERQALVDGLTGLANRRRTEEALDEEIQRAARLNSELTVTILDIDHFKQVNDRYGHLAGDVVLKEVALVLRQSVREIDTAGRWGGEEFALVLPGTDLDGGAQLAERIREALARRRILIESGERISVTASFGIANFLVAGTRELLLSAADEALYRAKRAGRNRVEKTVG